MTCPDEATLVVYAEGTLPVDARPALEAHLSQCDACRASVAFLAGDPSPPPSSVPARFDIRERLGEGGMGVVYEAFDRRLDTLIALKMLRPDLPGDDRYRLEREARIARSIRHPNVCAVYDVGGSADAPFLVMERVHGQTLARWLPASDASPAVRVDIVRQIAAAVAAAHAEGIVHRDLKPANIMIDATAIKVLDFGLAVGGHAPGGRAGTPQWWAPEQARGEKATAQSDVYALGQIAQAVLGSTASRRMRHWIARCLSDAPGDRYPNAGEALAAMDRPRRVSLLLLVLVLFGMGLGGWLWRTQATDPPPTAHVPSAERAYQAGRGAFAKRIFWKAADHFEEALTAEPDFATAALWLALAQDWRGDHPAARAALARVIVHVERLPRRERYLMLALDAKLRHDTAEAIVHLDALLAENPNDFDALFMRGDLAFHAARYPAAIRAFRVVVDGEPDFAVARQHLIWALYHGGYGEEAQQTADAWWLRTRAAGAGVQSAAVALANGDAERARSVARSVTALHPNHANARGMVALSELALGEPVVALQIAQTTVAQLRRDGAVDLGSAIRQQAWLLQSTGQFEAADRQYAQMIARMDAQAAARSKDSPLRAQLIAEHAALRALMGHPAVTMLDRLGDRRAAFEDKYVARHAAFVCWVAQDELCLTTVALSGWPGVMQIKTAFAQQTVGRRSAARQTLQRLRASAEPDLKDVIDLVLIDLRLAEGEATQVQAGLKAFEQVRFARPLHLFARSWAKQLRARLAQGGQVERAFLP